MAGAPHTLIAPLVGAGCASETADGCGLKWWVVVLVNFSQFFIVADRDRDFSLQLFLLWLLLQLYVLHTTMRTAFRRIDSQESARGSVEEEWDFAVSNDQARHVTARNGT